MGEKSLKKLRNNNSQPTMKEDRGGEKKLMKKVLNSLLALALVFTLAVPAFAAEDEAEEKQAASVDLLVNLGILIGYEDGSLGLENDITRAEFATVAVRMLGLESAANLSTGATAFADVPADHWSSGYVNVAVQQGLLKGYPDGTFQPNNNVTYAESLTILVRMLGYEPAVQGTNWPANYLVQANRLGLTDNVDVILANAPAPRGIIAQFADNALTEPKMIQVGYGDEVKYVISGQDDTDEKTLLSDNLNATKLEDVIITDAYFLVNSNLDIDDKEITVAAGYGGAEKDFETLPTAQISGNIGVEVDLWMNDDDQIFLIKQNESAKTDEIDEIDVSEDEITLDDANRTYDVSDALILRNYQITNINELEKGDQVEYVSSGNKIMYIHAFDYTSSDIVGVVEEVIEDDDEIRLKLAVGRDVYVDLDDDQYTIINGQTGQTIDFDDIDEFDVIYTYGDSDENFVILVSKERAEGEFDRVRNANNDVYIDGKKYKALNKSISRISFSVNDGDDFKADYDEVLGQDVEAGIGLNGQVVYMIAGDRSDGTGTADYYFAYGAKYDDGLLSQAPFLLVYDKDGDKIAYEVDNDTEWEILGNNEEVDKAAVAFTNIEDDNHVGKINDAFRDANYATSAAKGTTNTEYSFYNSGTNGLALVELDVDSKGVIETLTIISNDALNDDGEDALDGTAEFTADATSSRIKTDGNDFLRVAKDVLVVEADDANNTEVKGTIDVTEIEKGANFQFYYLNDEGDVAVIFASEGTGVSNDIYGVLIDAFESSKDDMAQFLLSDGSTTELLADASEVNSKDLGKFYQVKISGSDLDGVVTATYTDGKAGKKAGGDVTIFRTSDDSNDAYMQVTDVGNNVIEVKNEGNGFDVTRLFLDKDVVVFDVSDPGNAKIIDADDINEDDYVIYYAEEDGEVVYLVITDRRNVDEIES